MDGLHINSGSVLINTKRHDQRKQNRNLNGSGSFECSKQSILSSMDKFVRTVQSMHGTILVPSRLRDMRLRSRLPDCQITLLANSAGGRLVKSSHSSTSAAGQLKTKPLNSSNRSTNHSHFHHHHHLHHHLLHNHHLQDYHLGYHQFHSTSTSNSLDSSPASFNSSSNRLNYDPAEIPSALMNADLYNFYSMLYDVKQQLLWGPASGQSTIYTNYNTNSDLNQSNTSRFMMDKSTLHQLNSTMANCSLNHSDTGSIVQLTNPQTNGLTKDNRAESTCSSGYSSNSSTRNSTTNLSFIAQCSSPSIANCSNNSTTSSLSTRPPSSVQQHSVDDARVIQCNQDDVKLNDSTVSSSSSTSCNSDNSETGKLVDCAQSKTPQSDSDLESELESDSILTDRTSEPITDQTQLLASAFRHHLQALHTILDQLTHSAEYLSRNYELDLGEDNC